jgi:hypothetical protein
MFTPDPNFFHPRSRIRIKENEYFNPKKWFLSSRKWDPDCSSRIRILTFYPSRIPDPGVKRAQDPGSRFRIRNTAVRRRTPGALPKVLLSVRSWEPDCLVDLYGLLDTWPKPDIIGAPYIYMPRT